MGSSASSKGTRSLASAKSFGSLASTSADEEPMSESASPQANNVSSSDIFMISSCSRRNAFSLPSPYSSGMLTSNRPSKLYAISSALVAFRSAAQDIRMLMLASLRSLPSRYSLPIPEASEMRRLRLALLPKFCQSLEKNSIPYLPTVCNALGASSS